MKVLLTTIGLGLLIVVGFNYWVDAGHQWHTGHNDFPARRLNPGEAWIWPPIMEDHIARWEQIKTIQKPDVVSYGSCRSFVYDSTMFKPGVKFFNAAVGEISIFDYVALWQAFRENGIRPQYLVIFADPWILNRNNEEINRWGYNADYLDRFLGSRQLNILDRWRIRYHRLKAPFMIRFVKAQMLLHFETLRESFRSLRKREAAYEPIIPEAQGVDRQAYRWDGSVILDEKPVDPAKLRLKAIQYGWANPVYNLGRWKIDGVALKMMNFLLQDVASEGVKVMIIITPYHPAQLQVINQRPGYSHIFSEVAKTLAQLAKDHSNTSVCNAIDPKDSGCTEEEFVGPYTMGRSCAQKVLAHCLDPKPDWKVLLPKPS